MDLFSVILVYLLAGAGAGLIAGLLGVGGGIVVVPVLIFVFESQGFSSSTLTHLAVGSSLATIVLTSLSSVYSHHLQGSVNWPVWRTMLPGILLGAALGVLSVMQIDGESLRQLIGLLAVLVAIKILYKARRLNQKPLPRRRVLVLVGAGIGWVSAMFGIGGGTMSVPFLSRYRVTMVQVVGTSSAIGLPIAVSGVLTNIALGFNAGNLPDFSTGFVYWPAVVGVACASIVFARLGARWAHALPEALLKKVFALLLLCVGVKFLFF